MAVLVTGATGLIGSHVVDLLIARGESVRALIQPEEAPGRLAGRGVEICRGDIRDHGSLAAAVAGMECVLHCAARTGSWGPRADFEAVNVRGLEKLLELSLTAGVRRIVHVSSIVVFGADVGGTADENAPLRIERHNPYSWSKVMGEYVVRDFVEKRKAPVTVVRPGWVYGARDAASFGRFAAMVQGGRMILMGSGSNHVPLIYVTDAAQGILLASQAKTAPGQTYTLVNDEPVTQGEYFSAIAGELGVPPPRIHIPYGIALLLAASAETAFRLAKRPQPPPLTRHGVRLMGGENRLSIGKARRELGFSPRVNLAQGVRLGVEWFRRNGSVQCVGAAGR